MQLTNSEQPKSPAFDSKCLFWLCIRFFTNNCFVSRVIGLLQFSNSFCVTHSRISDIVLKFIDNKIVHQKLIKLREFHQLKTESSSFSPNCCKHCFIHLEWGNNFNSVQNKIPQHFRHCTIFLWIRNSCERFLREIRQIALHFETMFLERTILYTLIEINTLICIHNVVFQEFQLKKHGSHGISQMNNAICERIAFAISACIHIIM